MLLVHILLSLTVAYSQEVSTLSKFESEGMKLQADVLTSGQGVVWGMNFITVDELIFTKRSGGVAILNIKTLKVRDLKGAPSVAANGQGGTLDVLVHHDFAKNKQIFISYAVDDIGEYTTEVSRYTLEGDELKDRKRIFTVKPSTRHTVHFGSRLALTKDDHLFITVGDRGMQKLAQDLNTHIGKVIRIKSDGSVPSDNPFVGQKNKRPEIWSYGHRNPQGLFLDQATGELWEQEHGPRGGDEINLIKKGANYGWPLTSYGREYYGPKIGTETREGVTNPVHYWVPSIAPSGLMIYKGDKLPKWKGNLFSGALVLTHLNRVVFDSNKKVTKEERLFDDKGMRVRSVIEGPDGWMYFSTDDGRIIRITTQSQ